MSDGIADLYRRVEAHATLQMCLADRVPDEWWARYWLRFNAKHSGVPDPTSEDQ